MLTRFARRRPTSPQGGGQALRPQEPMTEPLLSRPRSSSAMRAISCSPRWAAPGSRNSRRRACSIVGAGGLGAPVALYLAAAGIGTLGIVDDDMRQPFQPAAADHPPTERIGAPKVESARDALAGDQPACERGAAPGAADGGERRRAHRRLRRRRRRLRQFSHALPRRRRLRRAEDSAGDGGGRPLRRLGDGAEAL